MKEQGLVGRTVTTPTLSPLRGKQLPTLGNESQKLSGGFLTEIWDSAALHVPWKRSRIHSAILEEHTRRTGALSI